MLNKKGSSLVELVISIALMSVVLVFMMKLLVDLNNTETNNSYAKKNEVIRSEIIRMISNDLNENNLDAVSSKNGSSLEIKIEFSNKQTSEIKVDNNTLTYTSVAGKTRKWTLKQGKFNTSCIDYKGRDENGLIAFEIGIQVHTSNDLNNEMSNNILDDILISYVGSKPSTIDVKNICQKN